MRKTSKGFLFILVLATVSFPPLTRITASQSSRPKLSIASDLIMAVNQLRAAYGMAPYETNPILMDIAQSQAEYMAAIGVASTHIDAQGRRPYQRALAAGYMVAGDLSNGSPGWFSENVTGGIGLSPQGAVDSWMGDAPHQGTMLSNVFMDVGAGVAIIGNTYYYCLDAGLSTGGTPVAYTPPPPLYPVTPTIIPNTPNSDGSILHIVQAGDTLGSISSAYGIPLADILALNKLTLKSTKYVNQEVKIREAYTPTPTLPTATPTPLATITPRQTTTITPTMTDLPPTPTPSPGSSIHEAGGMVAAIFLVALGLAGLSTFIGRKSN
jgi:uncharacterized protein YkwD/LysM repeat protein